MSFKRLVKYKFQGLPNYVDSLALPKWVNSLKIRLWLMGLVALSGIIFVAQTSTAAKSGYQMHDLENQVASLNTEIHKMEVDIADYSSMGSIQNRLKDSGMVAVGKIKYVTGVDVAVAKR